MSPEQRYLAFFRWQLGRNLRPEMHWDRSDTVLMMAFSMTWRGW